MNRPLLACLLTLAGGPALAADPLARWSRVLKPAPVMPLTQLAPAVAAPGHCLYSYPVTTTSRNCQAFSDQALGAYYSYVWIEAARGFETALQSDPECAFAWLGLARSLEQWGKGGRVDAPTPLLALAGAAAAGKPPERYTLTAARYCYAQAQRLSDRAGAREQLLIRAKLQEKGHWPDTPADEKKERAARTLDELLTLYDDDQEAWFARAQVAEGKNAAVPFFKALLLLNPLHPGANHELVHHYENIRRPALGWPHAEKYIESSPGIPHAFHMQAHLAMRVGKWKHTTDWSWRAVELEREYHQSQKVAPRDDHQYPHHLEILTKSLLHEGRHQEARVIQAEAKKHGYDFAADWFQLALAEGEWAEAKAMADKAGRADKFQGAYLAARLALERGEPCQAELDVMRRVMQAKPGARANELRYWEVQGRALAVAGDAAGVKLLKRAVNRTKDDFTHHAWGRGAYFMEAWGQAALDAGQAADAEEAFLEALAHDAGSVRAALGLMALCQRQGRQPEAARYRQLADRAWGKAERDDYARLEAGIAKQAERLPRPADEVTGSSH